MKIKVAKSDLDAALAVVGASLAGGGTDITSHFLFRVVAEDQKQRAEVLTFSGRTFAGCPLQGAEIEAVPPDTAFTIEGKRLRKALANVTDAALTFEFDPETKVTTMTAPRGKIEYQSLDPAVYPYFDPLLAKAEEVATLLGVRFHSALDYARQFVSDKENRKPELCVTEVREGTLFSTDETAAAMLTVQGLGKSNLRLHGKDANAVLAFLSTFKGDEDVTILEHDRALLLRRPDGAVFGESRFQAPFPKFSIPPAEDQFCWVLPKAEIGPAVGFLESGAAWEDIRLRFRRPDNKGPVLISMNATTGKEIAQEIPVVEEMVCDDPPEIPEDGFVIAHSCLRKVLANWEGDTVPFGINIRGKGGYVRVVDTRFVADGDPGDEYLTLVAWLR